MYMCMGIHILVALICVYYGFRKTQHLLKQRPTVRRKPITAPNPNCRTMRDIFSSTGWIWVWGVWWGWHGGRSPPRNPLFPLKLDRGNVKSWPPVGISPCSWLFESLNFYKKLRFCDDRGISPDNSFWDKSINPKLFKPGKL
jgi:hypothetical protein